MDADPHQNLQQLFKLFIVLINEFKSFKIVKICLMIKIKFFARKDPDPYLTDPDADPEGPITSGSGTLLASVLIV